MNRGSWPIALGASLLLHALIFSATTRFADSQPVDEPKFLTLEVVSVVDQTPLAEPASKTKSKSAPGPQNNSSKTKALPKTPNKPGSPLDITAVSEKVQPSPQKELVTTEKTDKVSEQKPLENPVAVIPSSISNVKELMSTVAGSAPIGATDTPAAKSAEKELDQKTVGGAGEDHSPSGGSAEGGIADRGPSVIYGPLPEFPKRACRRSLTGILKAKVLVSETGTVKCVTIFVSSGHACLDESALKTLRLWRFSPAYLKGRAIESWVVIPIEFKLK